MILQPTLYPNHSLINQIILPSEIYKLIAEIHGFAFPTHKLDNEKGQKI